MKRNSLFLTIRAGARNPPLLAVTMLALFSATAWLALWWASHRDRSLSCGTPEARDPYDPAEVRRVAETVLDGPGEAPNTVRRSVEVWAARLGGGEREEVPIPSELEGYVQKVALYAYKVTDEDVEELKARGYSEDAIFEINIAASLGAGLARVEKGLGVLTASFIVAAPEHGSRSERRTPARLRCSQIPMLDPSPRSEPPWYGLRSSLGCA